MEKLKKWIGKLTEAFKLTGIPFLIGMLGAYSGSEGTSKNWRRILIPVIFTLCALCELRNIWAILLMTISAWLSMGYGETSVLRKFWKGNNYLTRGTIGLGIALSFLIIPILKSNWVFYFLGSVGIILVYAFVSWRGFGEVILKWKGKNIYLLKVDMVTYGVLGICGMFIILKG